MPFDRINATQFAAAIRRAVFDRNEEIDVSEGDLSDTTVVPQARVLEVVHDRIRKLSLINTLANASEFDGVFAVDLEGIVFNEGMTRQLGSLATVTLVFSRAAAPPNDLRVQRGFPVATLSDEASGQAITFVTTEERTMFAASASSFFNPVTLRYELSVPAVATVEGPSGRAGPNRVQRPLRPLAGFDTVTNTATATGGRDVEDNADLIRRYLLAIRGRRLSTSTGVQRYTLSDFPSVVDALTVSGDDPLLVRAGDDAGAVDCYIIGEQTIEVTENLPFIAATELIEVTFPPMVEVLSVTDITSGITYVQDDDYEVVLDDSGNDRSTRSVDGIRFLPSATQALPTPTNLVTVSYTYNALIRRLQAAVGQDNIKVHGRDLLYKRGVEVAMAHEANLRVDAGFNSSSVQATVTTAVLDFINNLRLGDDVEESDIQGVVRAISGVDNYITTRLSRLGTPSGTGDVPIERNEYARIADTDYIVTLI